MTCTLRCLPVGFRRAMCFGPAMLAVLLVSLTTVSLADAQTLQVYAGAIAEPSEDLPWALQELALDPPFDNDVKSYSLRVSHTTTGISLVTDDFHGFASMVGELADGSDLSIEGWTFTRDTNRGGIVSVDKLGVGGNTVRIGIGLNAGVFSDDDVYTIMVICAAEVSSAAELAALRLSSGELRPPFATGTLAYEAVVPGGVTVLEISATPSLGGRVAISGRTSDGSGLAVNDTRVSGLAVGRNVVTISVTAEDGATHAEYSVVVHRDSPTGSVTLQDLQFSEGPPEPGFMAAATSGTLPQGTAHATPACTLGVPLSYTLDVSDALVTIRAQAAVGSSFVVAGATADGSALEIVNQSIISGASGHGAFLSVTLGNLETGANSITLTVSNEEETVAPTTTTVVVTRSASDDRYQRGWLRRMLEAAYRFAVPCHL